MAEGSEELDYFSDAEGEREPFQMRPVGAVSHDLKTRAKDSTQDFRKRTDEVLRPLVLAKTAHEEHDRLGSVPRRDGYHVPVQIQAAPYDRDLFPPYSSALQVVAVTFGNQQE